ncbi:MAG TPA: type II secretion system protein [Planctomycetota bacterium]|nr:type II secretion system protein [Planctomycetota bacterium]
MVEPRQNARTAPGFTLVEMLVALAILLVGVSSILATMSTGVDLRRTSDGRLQAELLAETALQRAQQQSFQKKADAHDPLDLQLQPLQDLEAEGFPGMRYGVSFTEDPARPDLVLARVQVRWLEQGEDVQAEFLRVLPKQEPFGTRVQRWLKEHGITR